MYYLGSSLAASAFSDRRCAISGGLETTEGSACCLEEGSLSALERRDRAAGIGDLGLGMAAVVIGREVVAVAGPFRRRGCRG